jgi:hypothetical protein
LTTKTDGAPTPDALQQITDLANALTWKRPDIQVLDPAQPDRYSGLAHAIQGALNASHARGELMLPDLAAFANETVSVFSDYGGESDSDYLTYSFLVCSWNCAGPFLGKMAQVRQTFGLGAKEIAYKDLRMGQVRAALQEYLTALNNMLPGFLFTVIIDKKIVSLFNTNDREGLTNVAGILKKEGLGDWKPAVAEKLLRVVHISAFLTALLISDGQKIFWMSDDDAICANQEMHETCLRIFGRAINLYADPTHKYPLAGGAKPFKERSVEMLDLLSVTDLVAGAVEQYLTRKDKAAGAEFGVKEGADVILKWLAHDGVALKRANLIIKLADDGQITAGGLQFKLTDTPKGVIEVPIVV